ncbi:MAG: hypothetical protein JW891_05600 [Candidatus Lokiarchaeota archaeon]|nr:hypothetical protein [Candidatus Lokiarchaeota archaeon]
MIKTIKSNFTYDTTKKAEDNFRKIQQAIKGLYDIINFNFVEPEEKVFLEAGEDNLIGLYNNLIELLTNEYGLRHLTKKINRSEIDLNIVLNELEAREFLEQE